MKVHNVYNSSHACTDLRNMKDILLYTTASRTTDKFRSYDNNIERTAVRAHVQTSVMTESYLSIIFIQLSSNQAMLMYRIFVLNIQRRPNVIALMAYLLQLFGKHPSSPLITDWPFIISVSSNFTAGNRFTNRVYDCYRLRQRPL